MTKLATQPTNRPLVCAIAYDGLCTFEFGIAVELFALPRPEFDNWYRFTTVKAEAGPVRALGGITMEGEENLDLLQQASLIIVPGWRGADMPVPEPLCAALRAAYDGGARIASICSGVFVLAAAGLLSGRNATTHWRYTDKLAQRFSDVTVDPDVLFVQSGRVFTSAGSAAGLDLGLHIIRQDYGAQVAASVARRLVLPAQRDGGQRQFVPRPDPKARIGSGLAGLQDRIRASLNEEWPIERMAHFSATSGRTLARRFHEEAGTTPLNWLKGERISRAAELLEDGAIPLSDVWEACGFGSAETFRREFRKTMGVPPVRYRERLGGPVLAIPDAPAEFEIP
ncbi:AraC family transcriptional regulator, transcriptional activator FtrA [Monaibacterium marinum]|uniref:AraC family transcriptional regulator, transcriptional activator FtrA n=1 Tax=Pontivivens marinum TaxID=1690039 RepID=A0A2C9CRM7_9RHOB|nr:transcriptional regulator FtrA [Monaibacterium marinum]SOH93907.1 AraC family transcriptional regulator, transcriptional activator FtrA [Monaibacterium marinum]